MEKLCRSPHPAIRCQVVSVFIGFIVLITWTSAQAQWPGDEPIEVDSAQLVAQATAARSISSTQGPVGSEIDLDSPLVNSYVNLPIQINDATSTSSLVAQTQSIINATQVELPPGSRGIHLVEVVKETLQRNLSLLAARQNPRITGLSVDSAWSVFDPVGFAVITYRRTNTPSAGFLSGSGPGGGGAGATQINKVKRNYFGLGNASDDPGLGVTRKLVTGTEVGLAVNMNRSDTSVGFLQPLDQEYRTSGTFSLVHPLMQGSGTNVNLATVRIAYNNTRISELDLRQVTLDTLLAAHTAYWEMVFARIDLAINIQSLGLAADLLRENRIRYKYGDLIAVDVLEAEAGVKQRERDVIEAQNTFENSRDRIRELIAIDRNREGWQNPLIPLDPPVFTPITVDETVSLDVTLKTNPEIQMARVSVQNAREGLILAEDRFRPRLDAAVTLIESGLGENINQNHSELFSGEYPSANLALNYQMPLYRRKEKADVLSSQYQIAQAEFFLRDTEQRIHYDHRQAVRTIESLQRQVEAAAASVRAEKDRLEKQKIGHEQGITTSHDLLEVQDSYARAQATQIRAIVDYYLAVIHLERIRGTLIDTLGLELVPMAAAK